MKLIVDNMHCNSCVAEISKAIHAIDPKAKITVSIADNAVTIEESSISQEAAIFAINQKGYQFVGIGY